MIVKITSAVINYFLHHFTFCRHHWVIYHSRFIEFATFKLLLLPFSNSNEKCVGFFCFVFLRRVLFYGSLIEQNWRTFFKKKTTGVSRLFLQCV